MKLIIGLGNPGEKYKNVRHNLGWSVVDALVASSKQLVVWEDNKKLKSLITKTGNVIFAKPLTYMNNSGMAVKLLTTYYKSLVPRDRLSATDIIVIHDELDLPLGKIKVRLGGAAAGHHGVESIIKSLGTDQFIRVRLGIGPSAGSGLALLGEHKKAHFNAEKFVLEPFMRQEKAKVKHMIKQAVKALDLLLEKGLDAAQNQFN